MQQMQADLAETASKAQLNTAKAQAEGLNAQAKVMQAAKAMQSDAPANPVRW